MWRGQFQHVTLLTRNMRTTGLLAEVLDGMRKGSVSDAAKLALEDRLLGYVREDGVLKKLPPGVADPRLSEPPFSSNPITFLLHRHNLRVPQSYSNALRECLRMGVRLYLSVACDETRDGSEVPFTEELRKELLEITNLGDTQNLPGVLPLYRGMRLLLAIKLCARLSLLHGCECVLEDILFAEEEEVPDSAGVGIPIVLQYLPPHLLLRAVDAQWILPESQLPSLPHGMDRRGLFLLPLKTFYFSHSLGGGASVNVRRTHFPVVPADSRIVHSAQGEGFEACIIDLAQPPRMSDGDHWLACNVMLSRSPSLDGVLILRLPPWKQLTRGPPEYLAVEMERLRRLEQSTVKNLTAELMKFGDALPPPILQPLEELFFCDEIGTIVYGEKALALPTKPVRASQSSTSLLLGPPTPSKPLRRLFVKTSLAVLARATSKATRQFSPSTVSPATCVLGFGRSASVLSGPDVFREILASVCRDSLNEGDAQTRRK